jgi:hypothetical protein
MGDFRRGGGGVAARSSLGAYSRNGKLTIDDFEMFVVAEK